MFSRSRSKLFVIAALGVFVAFPLYAADPPAAVTQQNHPEQFDRDGKHICGWSLMSESERAGYKSMMHNTKELADRDSIRMESCQSMRKRAQDKGVPLDE
ncbi:MAG TPA: hypothetical protein VET48_14645 [Steroidobacteraceae bacterium]|nr:hypothetical protein [Steroidobacteraceae bacterium]